MGVEDGNGRAGVKVALISLIGVALTALAAVIVALINTSSTAQSDPSPAPTSIEFSASTTMATASRAPTKYRRHFQVSIDTFSLWGDMVWRGNGSVASSGGLDLGDAEDSEKCRVTVEFTPVDAGGKPVAKKEVVGCPKDRPAASWPEFGPVEFDNDEKIANVEVVAYLDGQPVATFHCPRSADCAVS